MPGESNTRWLPLESNPDVMNRYAGNLGMPAAWQFTDIYGLDPELLAMVPGPVKAVLLLYPISEKSEASMIGEVKAESNSLYFLRQFIGNACGTIGLIHAVLNNATEIGLSGHLKKFLDATKDQNAEQRGKYLETDEGFSSAHEESAQEGQTKAPSIDEQVTNHFVAFIHKDGNLYELDGRKNGPILHGPTTEDNLLKDTADVVKKFMDRDPEELRFTLVALTKA